MDPINIEFQQPKAPITITIPLSLWQEIETLVADHPLTREEIVQKAFQEGIRIVMAEITVEKRLAELKSISERIDPDKKP
ncbi:MAG: hypothetical protein F4047_18620 [Caldilineaceae bacterium SB0670_bin_27]|uniref:Ribbon-helix-helix protein, CopG family n=1 Tax=Caldilineaceae bacterium SB0664_bin_27 TaxID=2605260 RepID=A0A6B0YPT8_9CHLR|nr:hypothetical protein [Caldilineaceae bacterium SB0664_bin_27]MYJ80099.1 hypothetical protein [Caldilineaceae bacterium SB0670_bin_27]